MGNTNGFKPGMEEKKAPIQIAGQQTAYNNGFNQRPLYETQVNGV